MKEKDLKNILLTLINEKENLNLLISSQNPEDINNNIIKIPTQLIKSKLTDMLNSEDKFSSIINQFDINFLENSLITSISALPSKLIGQIDMSFSIKIIDILVSNKSVKVSCNIYEHLDKNTPAIKKMAIRAFTKNTSIIETALRKISLPDNIKLNYNKNDFTFFVNFSFLEILSNLELKFKKSDSHFFYFDFKARKEQNANTQNPAKPIIKTGSISSMLNYSDRF